MRHTENTHLDFFVFCLVSDPFRKHNRHFQTFLHNSDDGKYTHVKKNTKLPFPFIIQQSLFNNRLLFNNRRVPRSARAWAACVCGFAFTFGSYRDYTEAAGTFSEIFTQGIWQVEVLTDHVQEEDSSVWAQAVLCICCHLEDSSTLVHVPDAVLHGAEIGVGHCNAISKIKLDVCPLEITLQQKRLIKGIHITLHPP